MLGVGRGVSRFRHTVGLNVAALPRCRSCGRAQKGRRSYVPCKKASRRILRMLVADYFAGDILARGVTRSGIASELVRFLNKVPSLQIILHRIPSLSSQLALDITARAIGAGVIAVGRLLLSLSSLLYRFAEKKAKLYKKSCKKILLFV